MHKLKSLVVFVEALISTVWFLMYATILVVLGYSCGAVWGFFEAVMDNYEKRMKKK